MHKSLSISIHAQANLSNFLTRNSVTSMDSQSSNDATDEHEGGIFGEYPNYEGALSETETDLDS